MSDLSGREAGEPRKPRREPKYHDTCITVSSRRVRVLDEQLKLAKDALHRIAAFDEPTSVRLARETLKKMGVNNGR